MNKEVSLSDSVYSYLFEMILSSRLLPGEKIAEDTIARTLGCSRAPIRDALKRLNNEGIIELFPRRFARVSDYSDELIKQIGVTRVFLDLSAAKLSILFGSNLEFMKMKKIAEECLSAAKSDDMSLRIRKDCEFHLELSKISKNSQLYKFARELYIRIEFIQASKYSDVVAPEKQYNEHMEIVDCLLQRDEPKILSILTLHESRFHHIYDTYPKTFFKIEF